MEEQIDSVDRISALPDAVIHQVLLFLPPKSVVVSSVLSKRWYNAYLTFPYLEFDGRPFVEGLTTYFESCPDYHKKNLPLVVARKKFLNHVNGTLVRFQELGLRMLRFKIVVTLAYDRMHNILNRWIELAVGKEVEELNLNIRTYKKDRAYNMPPSIFSATSVKVLVLRGCSLLQSFPRDDILKSSTTEIQTLELVKVQMDERILRSLVVRSLDEIEMVEIDAPNLHSLELEFNMDQSQPAKISIVESPGLLDLMLIYVIVEDPWLQDLISRQSFLCKLVLIGCHFPQKVNISSNSLNVLELRECNKLRELYIDAPNLLSFNSYISWSDSPLLTHHSLNSCKATFTIVNGFQKLLDTSFHLKLRDLISNATQFRHVDVIIKRCKITFSGEELKDRAGEHAPRINHLKLVEVATLNYSHMFDGLLWSCHPHTLSCLVKHQERDAAMMFVREILAHRASVDCCSSSHVQSWLRHVKDVVAVSDEGIQIQLLINGKVVSSSSVCGAIGEIKFTFEW